MVHNCYPNEKIPDPTSLPKIVCGVRRAPEVLGHVESVIKILAILNPTGGYMFTDIFRLCFHSSEVYSSMDYSKNDW